MEARKVARLYPLPVEIIAQSGLLFDIEPQRPAQKHNRSPAAGIAEDKSSPIMDAFKTRITQIRQQVTPPAPWAKAASPRWADAGPVSALARRSLTDGCAEAIWYILAFLSSIVQFE
jgi:hypothetical protein